jgi:7,8-dihydroneopterin aldolase/epimerase/oxygenase
LKTPRGPRKAPAGAGAPAGDRVFLEGLILRARIGVTSAERGAPQDLQADIALEADLARAGRSDRLSDTLNYALIQKAARRVAAKRTWSLLEALAEAIAADLFKVFPPAKAVRVTLRKPRPPFMAGVGAGGVAIHRRRA